MLNGFSKKKIKSKKTLGELFASSRRHQKITLDEAEIATKVRAKYLLAIEKNDWNVLPQEVYVRSFVLSYAKYLRMQIESVLEIYETEARLRQKDERTKITYDQKFKDKKILITPRFLAYGALALFISGMFGYIFFQITNFAGTPNLKILTPENNIVVENDLLDLSGVTDPDAYILVNEEKVPVTNDGHFTLNFKLHKGVNVLNVKAINKIKKESNEVYTIEFKPKTASADNINQ